MKSIQTSAIIEGIRAKKDRSLGLSISTPELSIQEKALFMELQGINVSLLITPSDESKVEEYKVNKDLEEKTPSQRMRNVMYRLWERDSKGKDFEDFYREQMEKLIEFLKSKIDE